MEVAYEIIFFTILVAYVAHAVLKIRDSVRSRPQNFGTLLLEGIKSPDTLAITGLMLLWLLAYSVHDLAAQSGDVRALTERTFQKDPVLNRVFAALTSKVPENVDTVPRHHFSFKYGNPFTAAYRQLLHEYPGAHFYAITSPVRTHVWGDADNLSIYRAMKAFTERTSPTRGRIDRIFVVQDPRRIRPDEVGVIQCHIEAGVMAHLATWSEIDQSSDRVFLLVEEGGAFGWKAKVEMNDAITEMDAYTDPVETRRLRETYNRVKPVASDVTAANIGTLLGLLGAQDPSYLATVHECRAAMHIDDQAQSPPNSR